MKEIIPPAFNSGNIPNNHDDMIQKIQEQIINMQKHLHSIQQYLRINNVEIVGLPEPSEEEETHEKVLLEALNSLEHISHSIQAT